MERSSQTLGVFAVLPAGIRVERRRRDTEAVSDLGHADVGIG
jgi:hypothetical protein